MRGIIVFYIDVHPEYNQDLQQTVDIVIRANQAIIERINKESDYQVMVVPTTKEACRVEKVDFDKPFPRFLPKSVDVAEYERRKADRETLKERQDAEKKLRAKEEVAE